MAFNWQTFRTRALTAIIFAVVMLVGLLWNQWSFLVLFSIIHFGCWWEYLKLAEKICNSSFHLHIKLGMMLIGYGIMLWFCGPSYHINGYGLRENLSLPVSGAGFILLLMGIFQKARIDIKAFGMAFLGLIYISLCWGLMISLGRLSFFYWNDILVPEIPFDYNNVLIPCIIILAIWVNDTMAYIVGSLIGRTPFSKISPKKTWEGTLGGMILSVFVIGLLFSSLPTDIVQPGFHLSFSNLHWFIIPAIAAIAGSFGDLLESKLKRIAGVKDSGSIMPGHGGFLDRFDSMLLATPCVWIYVKVFML